MNGYIDRWTDGNINCFKVFTFQAIPRYTFVKPQT